LLIWSSARGHLLPSQDGLPACHAAGIAGAFLLVGLVLSLFGWRNAARWLVGLAIAELLVLSFPPVGDALVRYLENRARAARLAALLLRRHRRAGRRHRAGARGKGRVSPPGERLRPHLGLRRGSFSAKSRRGSSSRVAATWRKSGAGTTEAAAMRKFLIGLGVPDDAIVDEDKSINTIENIRNVRAMVGKAPIAWITSTYHMPRAMRLAALAGLDAAPFATDYRAQREMRSLWENWIFSSDALDFSIMALREIVALNLDVRARTLGQ
jgi:uncharacterized SAM-binding protein YcdF (DUF218 family)